MSQSPEKIIKTVEIEVPPGVEKWARERAGDGGNVEVHLLDVYLFEYEWVFVGENEE